MNMVEIESLKTEKADVVETREEKIINERKDKIVSLLKKVNLWVVAVLIIAIILGVYIRSMPMQDHGGRPGLWDITTNTWSLGPDLDPFLFMRYAQEIIDYGSLPQMDFMRNVPLGFNTAGETRLLPYMIAYTYKFFSVFSFGVKDVSVTFAAIIFPVIMFAFTIIAFFLFVKEIFSRKDKKSMRRANIIALISTFFMIVIPAFLARTIAGIPEKESAAFFFMFLAFYLFLRAWKSEKLKNSAILAVLAGISTALMGLIWGGVIYVFVTIAIAGIAAFILNRVHKKEFLVYSLWFAASFIVSITFLGTRTSLISFFTSLDSGFAFLVFFILAVNFILWNTKVRNLKVLEKIKLPKNIISLILAVLIGLLAILIFFGPGFIIEKAKALNQIFFNPVTGRWGITVAENRQPYFTEWAYSFGPFIKNIPILFWLFFIGSVVLFKEMLSKIKKKDAWILTALYILFFFGLVFSRYAPHPFIFDGEDFTSKLFYYGSVLIFIGGIVYSYIKYKKEEIPGFEEINYEFLLLFSLFVLCLLTIRGAVRLIMVLAPVAPIFLSYLIVKSFEKFKETKDELGRIIFIAIFIVIVLLSIFTFWSFYKEVKGQAYSYIPSSYSYQWQRAMAWTRENTSENAVFAHWWDYGYWVQTMGKRATVVDGGNLIVYWNYLMGRLVLTGDNQADSLEFLYNHNATHLLIDSTDIGKYTAFSSIGSDENYDRYSWIPVMVSDEKQTQETRNGTIIIYQGGFGIDEDITYKEDGKEDIILPAQRAAIIGIKLETYRNGDQISFNKPEAIFYWQGKQYIIPVRYLYYNGNFADFKTGLEATIYVVPRIDQTAQGISVKDTGAIMYLSPRIMRGYLAQKYILNDPFNNFPNFKEAYNEPSLVVESLRSQNLNLGDFVYFQGIQGPIKIWEIKYTGKEKIKEEYLDTASSKYMSWKL